MSLYPVDRAAIRWWALENGTESDAAALREMIDRAMRGTLGEDWASKVGEAA